jgi:hypothetical protein
MKTEGIDGILIETHNWGKTVAFWQDLGYEVEFETDHHSGRLRHPRGGPYLFVAEQPHDHPLQLVLGVAVADAAQFTPPRTGIVVRRSRNNTGLPYRCCSAIPTAGSSPWKPRCHPRSSYKRIRGNALCMVSELRHQTARRCGSPCGGPCMSDIMPPPGLLRQSTPERPFFQGISHSQPRQ